MSRQHLDLERFSPRGMFAQISERLPERASEIEQSGVDDALLSTLVTTDLRENLPPQLLAVVAGVLKLVEGMDLELIQQEGNGESQSSQRK